MKAAIKNPRLHFQTTVLNGGEVIETGPGNWRLSIPSGSSGQYRWAQLDDYQPFERQNFLWQPPIRLSLRARVSGLHLAGTWGFGLWNDPFTMSMFVKGSTRKLPAPPNAAWFFYGSPPNHLAFRENRPANGLLASTFSAPRIPSLALLPAAPALPLLMWKPAARWLRRMARLVIHEAAEKAPVDPQNWHDYAVEWHSDSVRFDLDGANLFTTSVSPRGPLGLVLWIDNQFAAFQPDGALRFGTLPNDQLQWLEMQDIQITRLSPDTPSGE